ncbi:TniQ family protein [[Actinomadura] parvosata]|uniref:TniQ family protein n=1 Tax=[Actinomadura] parvosata TaxID=1955412 RepID=UPI00406BECF9
MQTPHDVLHRLPVTPPPFHRETLGSYLHRLALANNRPARNLAALLGPPSRDFSPISDDTSGWTPSSPQRLATMAGRPLANLAKALPGLASFLAPTSVHPEGTLGRACRCCSARRGAGTALVITHVPVHRHLCLRHQRWTRATDDVPLTNLPEVLHAQLHLTRLAQRHCPGTVGHALSSAQKIIHGWISTEMPVDLQQDWANRLDRVQRHQSGRDLLASAQRLLTAFPETVELTDLLLTSPRAPADPRIHYLAATAELGRRYACAYKTLGVTDPLYQYFRKSHLA